MKKILLLAAALATVSAVAFGSSLRTARNSSPLRVWGAQDQLPYEFDFTTDAEEAKTKAMQWTSFNFDNNNFKWNVGTDGLTLNLNEYGGKAQDAIVSPAFKLIPGEYDFSFSIKGAESGYPLNIGVYTGEEEPTAISAFTASKTITLNGSKKTYEEHNLKIDVNEGGTARFVFFTDKSKRYDYDPYDVVINRISISGQEISTVTVPYTTTDFSDFRIVNANGDSESDGTPTTWTAKDNTLKIDSPFANTDDWAISPALAIEAGKVYKLTVAAELEEGNILELFAGQSPAVVALVSGMGNITTSGSHEFLVKATDGAAEAKSLEARSGKISSMLFIPAGSVAFGIHAGNSAVATISLFSVTESSTDELERHPGNVTDLKYELNEMEATISWKAPACDNAREPLAKLDKIEVYRDNELLKTFDNPAVGSQMDLKDEPGEGVFEYKFIPYAGNLGPSEEPASISVAIFKETQELPFTIDFAEGKNVASADALWKIFNFDNDEYVWKVTENGFALNLDPKGAKNNDAVLTPRFEVTPGRYDITVRARGGDGYMPVKVGVVADENIGEQTFDITSLGQFVVSNSGAQFKDYTMEVVVEAGGLLRFAFSTKPAYKSDPKPSDLVIQAVTIAAHKEAYGELPYNPGDFTEFTIYNVNNDANWQTNEQITWKQEEKALTIDSPSDGDDWAITPLFRFEEGKIYQVSFDAEIEEEGQLETAVGSSTHFSDMTIPVRTLSGSRNHKLVLNVVDSEEEPETEEAIKSLKLTKKAVTIKAGVWAIGLHAPESGLQATITNFSIGDYVPVICPNNVEDLKSSVNDYDVTLTWINPSTDSEEEAITSLEKIELLRDGELVKTFETPQAGESMRYTETLKNGWYTYTVIPYLNGNKPDDAPASVKVEVDSTSSVESVIVNPENIKIYDLTGTQVYGEPGHGTYIVREANGKVRKMIR